MLEHVVGAENFQMAEGLPRRWCEKRVDRMSTPAPPSDRRPLKSRQSPWAVASAARLARAGVTPNAISLFSILCGLFAGAMLVLTLWTNTAISSACFVLAIVGIQGRLICNLLDGMVAVEGGMKTPTGDLYNEFPDRIADSVILIAAGYAADPVYGPTLGWCAALLAALTAYVRVAGKAAGAGVYFIGPMAKQHRMALLTLTCAICAVIVFWNQHRLSLSIALWIVNVGCVWTLVRRTRWIARDLRNR
jgi:phosphatidylglycerophosphate synthase